MLDDAPTSAQLKHDIDTGRTRDKVANADPGLSPLGTDDEAAGTPASPDAIALARSLETRRSMGEESGEEAGAQAAKNGFPLTPVALGVLLALAIALVVWFGYSA